MNTKTFLFVFLNNKSTYRVELCRGYAFWSVRVCQNVVIVCELVSFDLLFLASSLLRWECIQKDLTFPGRLTTKRAGFLGVGMH